MAVYKRHPTFPPLSGSLHMEGSKQDRICLEGATILRLVADSHQKPAAKKLRKAARILAEAGGMIARLPDGSERTVSPEELEVIIRKKDCLEGDSTALADIAWAMGRFQARYPRIIGRKLAKAAKLIQEAADREGDGGEAPHRTTQRKSV